MHQSVQAFTSELPLRFDFVKWKQLESVSVHTVQLMKKKNHYLKSDWKKYQLWPKISTKKNFRKLKKRDSTIVKNWFWKTEKKKNKIKMDEARVIFIEIPTVDNNKSRSVSPVSPSIYREKNTGFFDMLTRRFGRRSNDELYYSQNGDEDTRSSSTESCSSTSVQFADRNENKVNKPCKQHMTTNCHACNFTPNRNGLNSASDSSIDSMIDNNNIMTSSATTTPTSGLHVHRRSTSSLRRAIQNLSILSRSQSCSSTITTTEKDQKIIKKTAKKTTQSSQPQQQKCILRQPISYTYVKGMSGLPQRVPKSTVCCHYSMHR